MVDISIIVPTFNEEESIKVFLKELKNLNLKNYEVIIVDDSLDKTSEIAKEYLKKLRINGKVIKRFGKRGKGSAIRDGINSSKGKIIVLIDADLEYPVNKIPVLIKKLENYDIVNTKRILRRENFLRKFLGIVYRLIILIMFGLKIEVNSTMRAFKREVAEKIKFYSNGWAWDVEFIYKAKLRKFKIGVVDIVRNKRVFGESKIKIRRIFLIFFELLKIRFKASKELQ